MFFYLSCSAAGGCWRSPEGRRLHLVSHSRRRFATRSVHFVFIRVWSCVSVLTRARVCVGAVSCSNARDSLEEPERGDQAGWWRYLPRLGTCVCVCVCRVCCVWRVFIRHPQSNRLTTPRLHLSRRSGPAGPAQRYGTLCRRGTLPPTLLPPTRAHP